MRKTYLTSLGSLGLLTSLLFPNASPWAAGTTPPPSPDTTPSPLPRADSNFLEKERYTFQIRNATVRAVAEMIAEKAGLQVNVATTATQRVTFSLVNQSLLEALDLLALKGGIEYEIASDTLIVRSAGAKGRSPASAGTTSGASGSLNPVTGAVSEPPAGSSGLKSFILQYTTASAVAPRAKPFLLDGEQLIPDDATNTLIFQGSTETYAKLADFIRILDQMPQQILIDAQIVETSRLFLESIGVSYGHLDNPTLTASGMNGGKAGYIAQLPGPTAANLGIRYNIATINGSTLGVQMAAAESSGDAKIISRPKVVTLNNTAAKVNSGVSIFVKTLSPIAGASDGGSSGSSSGGTSSAAGSIAGGLQRVQSGLQLDVLPTIMAKDLIRLKVTIDNSQPDESTTVDGIPGIISNMATTSVIVGHGRTAVIAGLVKNSKSHSAGAIPFLSKIPILGGLFSNYSDSERNNELAIFITPQLVTPESDLRSTQASLPSL